MKQILTQAWAKLRAYRYEAAAGALTGVLIGVLSQAHGERSYQAHFFQRATYRTPAETVVRMSPARRAAIRRRAASSKSSSSRRIAGIRDSRTVAMNATDQPLRAAAPAASSASTSSVRPTARSANPEPYTGGTATVAPAVSSAPAEAAPARTEFPALEHTVHPVSRVPNWGAMRTPAIWNRTYQEMTEADFVSVPAYNLSVLTIPMSSLTNPITEDSIPKITAKLYYSTRPWGAYDVDAGEHSGRHDGVDLKLAIGTPVGAIGGGRVMDVASNETLGLHVLIEHRTGSERYLSIYGHLQTASVEAGQDVRPGQTVGRVGMTGNTSGPHLHLALHKAGADGQLRAYDMSQSVHPLEFIARYRNGN